MAGVELRFALLTVCFFSFLFFCLSFSEAFGVLSDSAKRAAYDRGSEEYDDAQGRHHTSFWDEQNAARNHSHNAHQRNNGPHAHASHHFTRSNAFDIFNAFFGGHNPFGGNGHMQDPFASMGMGMGMGPMGGGLFGSPFGSFGNMMGNINGGGGGQRSQHMRAHTDPFAGMLGGMGMMGMGMGGGGFSMMSSGFGGGFGGGSSTSSSTSYDSAGRMITQTIRTTFENGQSKSVTTTQVQHPDGRIESSESHSINGQPLQQQPAALPSGRTPSPSMGRNIPISAGAPPRPAAVAAPAAPRSPPIDLRSSSSSSSSSDSDDDVQEIPAPIRRSPARAAPRPTYHPPAPAATAAPAPSIPADHFSHMRMHDMSHSQSQYQSQGQSQGQTQAQSQQQRPPAHFSFTPSTHSPPMHQRSATHSFGSTGYSQEQMSAMRRDPYAQQQQQQQQQQHQRDIDARLEQSRLATQRAQQELDAQRASLARMREEAAAAASRHLAHQRASSVSQTSSFSSARSGSPSTMAATGSSPVPPTAGMASPASTASAYAAPLPHVRTSSGGYQHPSTAGKSPSHISAARATTSAAATATDPRSNSVGRYPPATISSVTRGVSGDLLNRRGDRTFDECFSEHASDQRRRTKL